MQVQIINKEILTIFYVVYHLFASYELSGRQAIQFYSTDKSRYSALNFSRTKICPNFLSALSPANFIYTVIPYNLSIYLPFFGISDFSSKMAFSSHAQACIFL